MFVHNALQLILLALPATVVTVPELLLVNYLGSEETSGHRHLVVAISTLPRIHALMGINVGRRHLMTVAAH